MIFTGDAACVENHQCIVTAFNTVLIDQDGVAIDVPGLDAVIALALDRAPGVVDKDIVVGFVDVHAMVTADDRVLAGIHDPGQTDFLNKNAIVVTLYVTARPVGIGAVGWSAETHPFRRGRP